MERFGPTRRGGPLFRWLGEELAIDLANTIMVVGNEESIDLFSEDADLVRWLELEGERLGQPRPRESAEPGALDQLRELRDVVHVLFEATAKGEPLPSPALDHLNAVSLVNPAPPQLSVDEKGHASVLEKALNPNQGEALGVLARSAIRLLAGSKRDELHICTAPSCGMFFLGNRRWCCSACGNRARVARHYERNATSRRGGGHGARD